MRLRRARRQREPADDETPDEHEARSKSTGVMVLQGAAVFLVMFVALWMVLRRSSADD